MKYGFKFNIAAMLLLGMLLASCRGQPSEKPPIMPIQQNMYWQQKYLAFEPNEFFEDGRAMRLPVEGTIARGNLQNDNAFFRGVTDDGDYIAEIPAVIDRAFLNTGRDKYNIYCQPCHGGAGFGDGIVIGYGYVPPPSFHDDEVLEMPNGQIYSAIYNGAGTMPSYRNKVNRAEDRWAIVAYIRAMQISQGASADDIRALGLDPSDATSN